MRNTLAKHISDYSEDLASGNKNPTHKPFFFSVPNYHETSETLESIISLPHCAFIEVNHYNKHKKSFEYLWDELPDLVLCLSTIGCYTGNLAHIFADSLDNRFALNGKKNMEIATCLHESITNSMFHGNLKMRSDFRTTKGLYAYQEEIKKRLILDHYRFASISLLAWHKNNSIKIAISDDGNGFSLGPYKEDDKLPNGRGLMMIQALSDKVWVGKGQKILFMEFYV